VAIAEFYPKAFMTKSWKLGNMAAARSTTAKYFNCPVMPATDDGVLSWFVIEQLLLEKFKLAGHCTPPFEGDAEIRRQASGACPLPAFELAFCSITDASSIAFLVTGVESQECFIVFASIPETSQRISPLIFSLVKGLPSSAIKHIDPKGLTMCFNALVMME